LRWNNAESGQNDRIMSDIRSHFTLAKRQKIVTRTVIGVGQVPASTDLWPCMLYDERPGAQQLDALIVPASVLLPTIFKLVI